MDFIHINLGEGTRNLRIEPDQSGVPNRFKIFSEAGDDSWREKENIDIEEIPVDNLLGTITIRNQKDFTFDGKGALSGEDLLFIAGHITKHPAFKPL